MFVCRANIGRSQAAAAFYQQLELGHAESAGTLVENPGQEISDWDGSQVVIDVMRNEHGIDISNNVQRQLTEELMGRFTTRVFMAEIQTLPDYINKFAIETWPVTDLKDKNYEETRRIIGFIKYRVEELGRRIGIRI